VLAGATCGDRGVTQTAPTIRPLPPSAYGSLGAFADAAQPGSGPVVSGVGHETDVTLADFVADLRAPTPSAAAELAVPDRLDVVAALRARRWRLDEAATGQLAGFSRRVGAERRALERLRPATRLAAARERGGYLLDRATAALHGRIAVDRRATERAGRDLAPLVQGRLRRERGRLAAASAALGALGPEATLARGYAIVRRSEDGAIIRDPAETPPGTRLRLRVALGELAARAEADPDG